MIKKLQKMAKLLWIIVVERYRVVVAGTLPIDGW